MAGHISDEDSENITREDPSMQGPRGSRYVVESGHPSIRNIMAVDDNLLVLCHDSGMKGCWFKSKVIQFNMMTSRIVMVLKSSRYLNNCDYNLRIDSFLLSGSSDKLGMRCTGHIIVRTQPLED
ncbi:hypothetical protein H5410_022610 [Solanum commersonii]|uniref:Uncharacterized protein n=1 Tax=Solanum commersonii TaxID=4109 RepID=A0A9J5ZEL7_SOLCO|nr:hypothetical protein H5410_022610 [Solanum commersonii]